jgi:hypothetical protein
MADREAATLAASLDRFSVADDIDVIVLRNYVII